MIPGEAVYGVILLGPFSFARFGRTAGECHHTQGKGEHNEELQADCLRRAASGWRRKERCAGRALLHPPALHSGRHLQGGCCCPEKDCRRHGRYFQRPAVSGGHRICFNAHERCTGRDGRQHPLRFFSFLHRPRPSWRCSRSGRSTHKRRSWGSSAYRSAGSLQPTARRGYRSRNSARW